MLIFKKGATGLTGRALAKALGVKAWNGEQVPQSTLASLLNSAAHAGFILRWGNDKEIAFSVNRVINSAEAVALARNKPAALEVMAAGGLRVPRFVHEPPAIGRTRYHQGGDGLVIWNEGEPQPQASYFLEIVPSTQEFRVHVVGGRAIAWQRKVKEEGSVEVDDLIRNFNRGWRFQHIKERAWLSQPAIAAVKSLGLDFGAVDILHNADSHQVWILEVNTAPALEGMTFERWVEALRGLIRGGEGKEEC